MTDIRLDDGDGAEWITLDSNKLMSKAATFEIMNDARKKKQPTPHRRALVHNDDDGLTINASNDYPGGVTINDVAKLKMREGFSLGGVAELEGPVLPGSGSVGPIGSEAVGGIWPTSLTIRGQILIEAGPPDVGLFPVEGKPTSTVGLQDTLVALQAQIDDLMERVAVLQAKLGI